MCYYSCCITSWTTNILWVDPEAKQGLCKTQTGANRDAMLDWCDAGLYEWTHELTSPGSIQADEVLI